jgi:HK97 gp10 family phage protein
MITAKVEGLTELKDLLQRKLPDHIQTKALQAGLAKAAQPIVQDARSRVPVKTGLLRRAIYSFRSKKSTKQKAIRLISVRSGRKQGKRDAFYWKFVEFGRGVVEVGRKRGAAIRGERSNVLGTPAKGWFGKTVKAAPAQPFMRPAFEARKYEALDRFKTVMVDEINKFSVRHNNAITKRLLRKVGL